MTTRVIDLFLSGVHTDLPAPATTPVGALFSCTTHSLIYKNSGSTWDLWASVTAPGADDEAIRDVVGATLVAGTNVTLTVDDAGDTITIDATGGGTTDPEVVRDTIASALVAGTNVTLTVDDVADTITINASGGGTTDPEVVRDTIATALVAGTNVTITPDDTGDTITISASGGGGGTTDPEIVRDTIATALVAGTGITITVDDAGDTITISGTAAVTYGTTAGTAAEGNDSRITGAAQQSANLSDLADAATARTNLGLGTAATHAATDFAPRPNLAILKVPGALIPATGAARIYNDTGTTWTITSVRATVEIPPSGGPVTVDVNKNGTTIFTNQTHRPSVASGSTTARVTTIDDATVVDGDYLTVDVDVTTGAASDLTVILAIN